MANRLYLVFVLGSVLMLFAISYRCPSTGCGDQRIPAGGELNSARGSGRTAPIQMTVLSI